jgi:hypothetical protein
LKKALISLFSLVILAFVTGLVIENIHALSNVHETTMTSNNAKNFHPWSMITSFALLYLDDTTAKNSEGQSSDSFKYTSVSSTSETRTVRTDFSYTHGFKFKNTYTNYYHVIPDKYIPDFIYDGGVLEFSTAGRCGGMAYAALDYWYAKQRIPGWDVTPTGASQPGNPAALPTPSNDAPLSEYILQRLHDSLDISLLGILKGLVSIGLTFSPASSVSSMEEIPRYIYLYYGPTENKGTIFGECTAGCLPGVRPLTDREVIKATKILDQKRPVVLGLVHNSAITKSHQVVAYGYQYDKAYNAYTFFIWDNNKPGMEIKASWYPGVQYGKLHYWYQYFDSKKGFVSTQFDTYEKNWKGFFVEDYTPKTPPTMFIDIDTDGIDDSRDNCGKSNPDQLDTNGNGVGDACEGGDIDNDGVVDSIDNCKWAANPDQKDTDGDGVGDACKDVIL